ncbi:hypothetical protein BpHYR1_052168 [Brachionus plicatilis]|uniref:Uncharacterized protein n=1 Tax=Brachionus plicatilis TaxID=10195 RepID=A0A3M7R516_BRAPC|nr:hypothetical protein BpHYR1_052168 [Brachionus plicatilis]
MIGPRYFSTWILNKSQGLKFKKKLIGLRGGNLTVFKMEKKVSLFNLFIKCDSYDCLALKKKIIKSTTI